jgi:mono/diheme cytochrome c family protein
MKMIFVFAACLFLFSSGAVKAQQTQDQSVGKGGKMIYEQNCLACHQADGSGVPGLAPPLIKGTFVNGKKEALVNIILKGMEGVEIKGEHYANPMPAFGYLSDQDIADLLTYVRGSFKNNQGPVAAEEVARVRKKNN